MYSNLKRTINMIVISKIALGYSWLLALSIVALLFVWMLRNINKRIIYIENNENNALVYKEFKTNNKKEEKK